MTKLKKYTLNTWCAVLAAVMAMMGFQSCHRAQKMVTDNDAPIDTLRTVTPPTIRDPGEIIALYGVPPSKFKEIKQQDINPKQIEK